MLRFLLRFLRPRFERRFVLEYGEREKKRKSASTESFLKNKAKRGTTKRPTRIGKQKSERNARAHISNQTACCLQLSARLPLEFSRCAFEKKETKLAFRQYTNLGHSIQSYSLA